VVAALGLRHWITDGRRLVKLAATAGVTLLVTAAHWVPMAEQMLHRDFAYIHPWTYPADNAVTVADIFKGSHGIGFGLALALMCALWAFVSPAADKTERRKANWLLVPGGVLLFAATTLFPWKSLPVFNTIQFPWRLYAPASLFIAFCIAVCLAQSEGFRSFKRIACALLVITMCLCTQTATANYTNGHFMRFPPGYPTDVEAGYHLAGEWLPVDMDRHDLPKTPQRVLTDTGQSVPFTRKGPSLTVPAVPAAAHLDLPVLYYKGYSAYYTDTQNQKYRLEVTDDGPAKTVRLYTAGLPENGTLVIRYSGTFWQHASFYATLLTLLALGAYYFNRRREKGGSPGAA